MLESIQTALFGANDPSAGQPIDHAELARQVAKQPQRAPRQLTLDDLDALRRDRNVIVERLTAANDRIEQLDPHAATLRSTVANKLKARQVIERTFAKSNKTDPIAMLALQSLDKSLEKVRDELRPIEEALNCANRIAESTHKLLVEFDKLNFARMQQLTELETAIENANGYRDKRRQQFPGDARFKYGPRSLEPEAPNTQFTPTSSGSMGRGELNDKIGDHLTVSREQ